MIRFPDCPERIGLGVGLDSPWGGAYGLRQSDGALNPRVSAFLAQYGKQFSYGFLSCHARQPFALRSEEHAKALEQFCEALGPDAPIGLHHTFLNLGAPASYSRNAIFEYTNALIDRHRLRWVNEDVGLWSMNGRTLPYPLPPLLTTTGLQDAVRNVNECQRALHAPLLIEFPGFTEGSNLVVGKMHAYDFFQALAVGTQSPVTLDTGHLLSYQWLLGKRGEDLYGELDRLPLEHCFEIHLSGCAIHNEQFRDYHHGILLDAQLELLELLLARCPNLKAVCYEDPKFSENGDIIEKALPNFSRLQEMVSQWQ